MNKPTRHFKEIRLANNLSTFQVELRSDECFADTHEFRQYQRELLRAIVDSPELLTCGPQLAEVINMTHDGERWIIKLKATGESTT